MNQRFPLRWRLSTFITGLVILKLWLTSGIGIIPIYAPDDASGFIEHAKSIAQGQWFGPYSAQTMVKMPFFPIYLAVVRELGIPLPISHVIIDACATLVACRAIRPLLPSVLLQCFLFAIMLFNPFSYDMMAWMAYRSQLNPSLTLLCVACAFGLYLRRDQSVRTLLGWSIGLGASLSAFWLTREEAIWLLPALGLPLAICAYHVIRSQRDVPPKLLVLGLPVVLLLGSIGTIMVINGRSYGWYVTNEQQSAEFVGAYNSLTRIEAPTEQDLPVPKRAREIAYNVSGAARELRPTLEDPNTASWLSGGRFPWHLRGAVSDAGHYTSGADARAFYVRLAREIDEACAAGTIRCRHKGRTMAPAMGLADAANIFAHFLSGVGLLARFGPLVIDASEAAQIPSGWTSPWTIPVPPVAVVRDYKFVVGKVAAGPTRYEFHGWLVHQGIRSVSVIGAGAEVGTFALRASPDVYAALSRDARFDRSWNLSFARFDVAANCTAGCSLRITMNNGNKATIPLLAAIGDFRAPGLVYHLDSAVSDDLPRALDDGFKEQMLRLIASMYRLLVPMAWLLQAIFVVSHLARRVWFDRTSRLPDYVVLSIGVAVSGLLLLSILAVIDAFAFPAFSAEYMDSLTPLILYSTVVALGFEMSSANARRTKPGSKEATRGNSEQDDIVPFTVMP